MRMFKQAPLNWHNKSKLKRFGFVALAGIATIIASPHENAISLFTWCCMAGWLYALGHSSWRHKSWIERMTYGFIYGVLYIAPGQCPSIWNVIQLKQWPIPVSVASLALFFFAM